MTGEPTVGPPADGELEALLEYLRERRNFDFSGYKRASLTRRIVKRMQLVNIDGYQRYLEILEANPGELAELFNTILINVTSLLRDKDAWDAVAARVIPAIVDGKSTEEAVRIWSAGCASGEEAYSLAVLFADAIGEDRFRRLVKIYATDADTDALATARRGRYRQTDLVAAFGEDLTARFFESDGDHGVFRGDLRRALIFGRHDLVQDPPISRLDLVTCRNTLMYFTADLQSKILAGFHFALKPGGYLFLGKSEALAGRSQAFQVVDRRQHIMRRDDSAPDLTQAPAQHLRHELERSQQELETAYEELESTVEELETTNEGLQSTNEELETTNEELNSTNEELETTNEGLQSTNDELETINNELRERSTEVTDLNQVLQAILGSLQSAVIVLGPEMEIKAWNRQAEELWGLRSDEVIGRHFLNFDLWFPIEALRTAVRDCLAGRAERTQVVESAVNRRGRAIECTVNVNCLVAEQTPRGVILMVDAVPADQPESFESASRAAPGLR
jgi:PAS domain S-box-containing protein